MTERTAIVGEAVLCDGETHLIVDIMKRYSQKHDALVQLVIFENPNRRVTGLLNDLRWDDELMAWYLWGRVLSKIDRRVVVELRDRALLPARLSRTPGNPPAGGEHLNLYKTLFQNRSSEFWNEAFAMVRPGGSLPAEAVVAIEDYKVVFKQKLIEGYADPGSDDSSEEVTNV